MSIFSTKLINPKFSLKRCSPFFCNHLAFLKNDYLKVSQYSIKLLVHSIPPNVPCQVLVFQNAPLRIEMFSKIIR